MSSFNSGKKEKCIQKLKVLPVCSNAASLGLKDINKARPAENVSLKLVSPRVYLQFITRGLLNFRFIP